MPIQTSYVTSHTTALEGMPEQMFEPSIDTGVAVAAIAAGKFVLFDDATPPTGSNPINQQVRVPAASGDVTGARGKGITVRSNSSESSTYAIGKAIPVMTEGKIWVKVEQAVVIADPVYVRYAAGGDGPGGFGNTAGTSERALLAGARYVSNQATIGGLALVELQG